MEQRIAPASAGQLSLASQVGLALPADLPSRVAAAMLEDHVLPRIWNDEARGAAPATERQVAYLEALKDEALTTISSLTKRTASAWIDFYLTVRNVERLRELALASGHAVIKTDSCLNQTTGELHTMATNFTVSSIGASGLVYFKGGNGRCAWPSELSLAES